MPDVRLPEGGDHASTRNGATKIGANALRALREQKPEKKLDAIARAIADLPLFIANALDPINRRLQRVEREIARRNRKRG